MTSYWSKKQKLSWNRVGLQVVKKEGEKAENVHLIK